MIRGWLRLALVLVLASLGSSAFVRAAAVIAPLDTLAFVSDRDGDRDIYLRDMRSDLLVKVTHTPVHEFAPAWRNAHQVAFKSYLQGGEIFQFDLETISLVNLTHNNRVTYYAPAWSPSGLLAFGAARNDSDWDVVVLDLQTGEQVNVTAHRADDNAPDWSPEGYLTFVSNRSGNNEIYLLDLESGDLSNLTRHPANDHSPAWSPDGRLAFVSNREANWEIFVFDPVTESITNVTRHPTSDYSPSWSADGRLAFGTSRDGNREIYLLNLVTNEVVNLTRHPADDFDPAWSW